MNDELSPWDLSRNTVMAASAGTGKTFNLVGVLLSSVLVGISNKAPLEPSQVLATTFSKRAAEEIKERVEHELARLGAGDTRSIYAREFSSLAMQRRARHLAQRIREFRITTIHGMCVEMLREHGTHVGVAPDFVILDTHEETIRHREVSLDAIEMFAREREADLLQLMYASGGLGALTDLLISWLNPRIRLGATS